MHLKTLFTCLFLSLVVLGNAIGENEILRGTSKELQNLENLKYHTRYTTKDPMGVVGRTDSAMVYYNFSSDEKIIGAKFLFISKNASEGFNGSTSFFTRNEKNHLVYSPTENINQLVGVFKSAFPIHTLRNLLPQILADKSIQCSRINDTTINNVDCFRFKFYMHGKTIFMNQELMENESIYMTYELSIGKQDLLPRQFINYFEDKSPVWIVDYYDYDLSFVPNDLLFDCNLGYQDYRKYPMQEYSNVLRKEIEQKSNSLVGTTVKDWTLPSMDGDSIKLSKTKSKVTLLEFWFPGCTGCVKIIPEVNKLSSEFKDSELQIFGVEFTKSDSVGLADYIKKSDIHYPTLYSGKEIAKEYGIMGAPTIVLLDKNRKVLYSSSGFNKDKVIAVIKSKLKFSP